MLFIKCPWKEYTQCTLASAISASGDRIQSSCRQMCPILLNPSSVHMPWFGSPARPFTTLWHHW